MMPWTHAISAYIAYSISSHSITRSPPTTRETIILVFASLLPDMIDKTLAWQLNILAGGQTLGHSIFTALLLSVAVIAVAHSRGQLRAGLAFVTGYLLHLPGDIIPGTLLSGDAELSIILWPITEGGGGQGESFYSEFLENVVPYVQEIGTQIITGEPSLALLTLLTYWAFAFFLWVYDGMPIGKEAYRRIRQTIAHAQ